jgi:hypothetical protein
MTDEEMALRMVARIAFGLLARYPFDSEEDLRERWNALARWLAALPEDYMT